MLFLDKLNTLCLAVLSMIKNMIIYSHLRCHIEEIDTTNSIITISFRGTNTAIKLRFDEIINDIDILSNLSSQQASYAGYYFGKNYKQYLTSSTRKNINEFSFQPSEKRYSIISQNRRGIFTIKDNIKNYNLTMSSVALLKNKVLIDELEPIQAFYIGMHAGISITTQHERDANLKLRKSRLSLIK